MLLPALPDKRLTLTFGLLLFKSMTSGLHVIANHLLEARMVLLGMQTGTQYEIRTFPLDIIEAGWRR
jgi:hypothetical protein